MQEKILGDRKPIHVNAEEVEMICQLLDKVQIQGIAGMTSVISLYRRFSVLRIEFQAEKQREGNTQAALEQARKELAKARACPPENKVGAQAALDLDDTTTKPGRGRANIKK